MIIFTEAAYSHIAVAGRIGGCAQYQGLFLVEAILQVNVAVMRCNYYTLTQIYFFYYRRNAKLVSIKRLIKLEICFAFFTFITIIVIR